MPNTWSYSLDCEQSSAIIEEEGNSNLGGRMKILIINDDGYNSAGLIALCKALRREHELFVCAPLENQSAVGHGLTLRRELSAVRVQIPECEDVTAYHVNGTPVDCLRIALGNLDCQPELVLSGINQAPNLGTDIISSGTVAGACEAAMLGYNAIAVSRDGFDEAYFDDAAETFCDMIPSLVKCMTAEKHLLNVNFPHTPKHEYVGIRTGRLAFQEYPLKFTETVNDVGEKRYKARSVKLTCVSPNDDSDEKLVRDGFITVTPLIYDYTDYEHISAIKRSVERDF